MNNIIRLALYFMAEARVVIRSKMVLFRTVLKRTVFDLITSTASVNNITGAVQWSRTKMTRPRNFGEIGPKKMMRPRNLGKCGPLIDLRAIRRAES